MRHSLYTVGYKFSVSLVRRTRANTKKEKITMKRFDELTEEQQEAAVNKQIEGWLQDICDGAITFDDEANGDDLQERIDAAFEEANRMKIPWFSHEYIMETCEKDIRELAQNTAENALYAELGDPMIVRGVIT
jgi:hypothetical protein